jgi:hypothetical protein
MRLAAATLALGFAGCHWLPVGRVDPSLDPRRVGKAPAPAPNTTTPPPAALAAGPLPEGGLQPISDAEAMAATAPTPLLDAAMARAQAMQDAATGAMPDPAPAPEALAAAEPPPRDDALVQTAAVAETAPIRAPEPSQAAPPAPMPQPAPTPAPEPAPTPEEAWRAHFEVLRSLAREREAQSDGEPWPLRAAVLAWLANDGEKDEERPAGDDGQAALWTALAETLAQATARADDPDAPVLREAITALEGQLPLRVGTLALCRKVQGFGQYEPIAEPSCRAGQTVVLYCELDGLRYEPEPQGGRLRSRLESTVELRAAEGDRVVWSQSLGTAEDVCRRRRRDYYVNYRLTLPDAAALPPGAYRLRIHQRDAIAGNEDTAEVALTIAATPAG